MRSTIGVILFAVATIILLAVIGFRTDHYIDLQSGLQDYERSILGITIEALSERNYQECQSWNNTRAPERGRVKIASCELLWGVEILNRGYSKMDVPRNIIVYYRVAILHSKHRVTARISDVIRKRQR